MKRFTIGLVMAGMLLSGSAQAQRIQQKMGRSVVAVSGNGSQNVLITWRKLAQEPENCTYNLYKRPQGATEFTRVNTTPIAKTNYQATRTAIPYGTEIAVTTVTNGVESAKSNTFLFKQQAYGNVFLISTLRLPYSIPMITNVNMPGQWISTAMAR